MRFLNYSISSLARSSSSAQERGVSDDEQGWPYRRLEPQRQRGILLCTGTPVATQLNFQVQGDRGRSPAAPLPARVPQCFAAGRRAPKVRLPLHRGDEITPRFDH